MKMYSPKSYVRKPMMYGGPVTPRKKMALGGSTTMSAPMPMPVPQTPPMGTGMMQDKRNKAQQFMMKKGGRVNKRSR